METASQIIHRIHGKRHPDCKDHEPFRCWVCGGEWQRGVAVCDFLGANFVGQNRVRAPESDTVCEPCAVVMSGKPPDTERMWTHLVEGSSHERVNKGGKPAIRAFLRREHRATWFGAIADSGKKHVVPWCQVNPPTSRGGRVLFEETLVVLPSTANGWALLDEMTELLTAGATKEEVLTGQYGPRAASLCGAAVRRFEHTRARERTSAWFELAIWLAQRDEATVQERVAREKEAKDVERAGKRGTTNQNRGGAPRDKKHVPRDAGVFAAQALGHDPGPIEGERKDERDGGAVGHVDGPYAPIAGSQRSLF